MAKVAVGGEFVAEHEGAHADGDTVEIDGRSVSDSHAYDIYRPYDFSKRATTYPTHTQKSLKLRGSINTKQENNETIHQIVR